MIRGERERLAEVAKALNVDLPADAVDRLVSYLDLLERWNRTYNLTAVRDRTDMLTQHVVDCMAIVDPLKREAWRHHVPYDRVRCLDVGSGGGLPAVVLATLLPDLDVVSVDAVGKKATFVRQVALELGLRNLTAEHARIENLRAPTFHVVTSRAFASLADFTRLTRRHLSAQGCWMAMKGQVPTDEMDALPDDVEVFHVEPVRVPGLDASRCLIWMRPETAAGT